MKKLIALLFILSGVITSSAQKHITTPEEEFGFTLGSDRKLADWNQLTAYYKKLSAESPAIPSIGE